MSDALKQLTEQLYKEGVAKAKNDAEEILAKATEQAEKTVKEAEAQAAEIKSQAEKTAEDLKRRTENEVKKSFTQALKGIEGEITDRVVLDFSKAAVKKNFEDTEFVKEIIVSAVSQWNNNQTDIQLEIAQSLEKRIDAVFIKAIQGKINQSVEVKVDPDIRAGFRLGPADGAYKITFREEDFQELIKKYLRPQVRKILFA